MSDESAKKSGQAGGDAKTAAPGTAPAPDAASGGTPETRAAGDGAPPIDGAASDDEVIGSLQAEVAELRDRLLRALAETENVRRRAERDRKDAEAYGGTRLARDMLTVYDNLDRALSHVDDGLKEQAKGFIEGVELTRRELLNAFAKHRIEKVTPAPGEKFDPHRHQAMFEAPIPGAEPGSIIEVMQAGFTIADRLLRPAMVGVARGMPQAPKESAKAEGAKAGEAGAENSGPENAGDGPDAKPAD